MHQQRTSQPGLHRITRLATTVILVTTLLLLTLPARLVHANGGPGVVSGSHGGAIAPRTDTNIWVEGETLRFTVKYGLLRADVEAIYHLRNRGTVAETSSVAFVYFGKGPSPIDSRETFPRQGITPTVTLDGVPIPVSEGGGDPDPEWTGPALPFLNPITGEAYTPTPYSFHLEREKYSNNVHIAEFTIRLEPGQTAELRVAYQQAGAVDRFSTPEPAGTWLRFAPIVHYWYFLQPARYWAGFEGLQIEVVSPLLSHMASNMPFDEHHVEGFQQVHTMTVNELPPENLSLAFKYRSILGIPLVLSNIPLWVVFAGVAVWLYRWCKVPVRHWLGVVPPSGENPH